MTFGDRVKQRRKEKEMTILELYAESGVSPPTICKVERGGSCTLATAEKLARALDIETMEFKK